MNNIVMGIYLIDKGIMYDYYGCMILASTEYRLSQHRVTKGIYIVRNNEMRYFYNEDL